jgi:uncharacterized protein YndB with AHSA1/START domain
MSSNARTGNRILGSLHAVDGTAVVRMEDRYDTDIDDLWSAITEPARLARWLGEVEGLEGDLRLGGDFRFHFFASGAEGTGRVEACEPPRRLLVKTAGVSPGESSIEVTLTADGDRAVLVWEERGMPVELLPAYGAGIQIHIEDLGAYLAGRGPCDARARWAELQPAYEKVTVDVG